MSDGGYGLYNFFSGEFLRMNYFTKDYYDHPEIYSAEHPYVSMLIKKGFLVDYDELAYLRNRVKLECGNTKEVQLTICPTLQCNFICPYCYETARCGRMSDETRDDVLAFAERLLKMFSPQRLSIVWYGGEPLLERGIIEGLSAGLIRLAEQYGAGYKAFIITNGYYLTPDCAELFRKCRIDSAQITLDGPDAATHDRTRHLHSGQGTFERIIRNIKDFKGDCFFNIRCNIHKDNADSYLELEDMLLSIGKETGREIGVYAGHMDAHKEYTDHEIPAEEYVSFKKKTMKKVGKLMYQGPVCTVPKRAEYTIDERGNIYKCLEAVGDEDSVIGSVKDFDPNDPTTGRMDLLSLYFEQAWPGDDAECMSCPALPVCMGGCPQKRLTIGKQCRGYKYALDEYVAAVGKELLNHDSR